ncbi:unnamed protein product [Escherichia coli]|nr:unnamed protein product [Escherichia coli]
MPPVLPLTQTIERFALWHHSRLILFPGLATCLTRATTKQKPPHLTD